MEKVTYPNSNLYWFGGWVYDFTKIATIFVFAFLLTHYFFFTIFIVNGASMDTTLANNDMMFVNRIYYKNHPVARGDIIALYFPGEVEKKFVKRVVGLPGETVTISEGSVSINGVLISEPYINGVQTKPDQTVVLEGDEYYVMGDNREVSSDSRIWGPLPKNYIIGKADHRLFNTGNVLEGVMNWGGEAVDWTIQLKDKSWRFIKESTDGLIKRLFNRGAM